MPLSLEQCARECVKRALYVYAYMVFDSHGKLLHGTVSTTPHGADRGSDTFVTAQLFQRYLYVVESTEEGHVSVMVRLPIHHAVARHLLRAPAPWQWASPYKVPLETYLRQVTMRVDRLAEMSPTPPLTLEAMVQRAGQQAANHRAELRRLEKLRERFEVTPISPQGWTIVMRIMHWEFDKLQDRAPNWERFAEIVRLRTGKEVTAEQCESRLRRPSESIPAAHVSNRAIGPNMYFVHLLNGSKSLMLAGSDPCRLLRHIGRRPASRASLMTRLNHHGVIQERMPEGRVTVGRVRSCTRFARSLVESVEKVQWIPPTTLDANVHRESVAKYIGTLALEPAAKACPWPSIEDFCKWELEQQRLGTIAAEKRRQAAAAAPVSARRNFTWTRDLVQRLFGVCCVWLQTQVTDRIHWRWVAEVMTRLCGEALTEEQCRSRVMHERSLTLQRLLRNRSRIATWSDRYRGEVERASQGADQDGKDGGFVLLELPDSLFVEGVGAEEGAGAEEAATASDTTHTDDPTENNTDDPTETASPLDHYVFDPVNLEEWLEDHLP